MKGDLNLKVILAGVLIVVVGITVAYAAMSTTLTVTTNNITQSSLSWNVGFQGTSATATAGGTSATGRSCGTATITASSVTVADTTLSKPDDSCTYTLTIKNSGTIPAKLTSISHAKPSGVTGCTPSGSTVGPQIVCGNITYTLASDTSGTQLTTNTTLAVNGTQTVYLIVKYTGTTLNSSAVTQSGASFSLVYSQQ